MFGWFKEKNIHENCHKQQLVIEDAFKMIRGSSRRNKDCKSHMKISEIRNLLNNFEDYNGHIGFYIESKCKHGIIHNNRILLWSEPNKTVCIEIQRPQDLCFSISHFKTVEHHDFESCFEDISLLISQPKEKGFGIEEWT